MQTPPHLLWWVLFNYGLTVQFWTVINNNQSTTAVADSSSSLPFIPFPLVWGLAWAPTQISVLPLSPLEQRRLFGKCQQNFSLTQALSEQRPSHAGGNPAVRPRSPAASSCVSGKELGTFMALTIAIGQSSFARCKKGDFSVF